MTPANASIKEAPPSSFSHGACQDPPLAAYRLQPCLAAGGGRPGHRLEGRQRATQLTMLVCMRPLRHLGGFSHYDWCVCVCVCVCVVCGATDNAFHFLMLVLVSLGPGSGRRGHVRLPSPFPDPPLLSPALPFPGPASAVPSLPCPLPPCPALPWPRVVVTPL